jgi:hypothetical protein
VENGDDMGDDDEHEQHDDMPTAGDSAKAIHSHRMSRR